METWESSSGKVVGGDKEGRRKSVGVVPSSPRKPFHSPAQLSRDEI